jgi:uncharacterized membrane protein YcjF (UPF0283 family)
VLAYNYPVLGAFLTMLWFFLWVIWIIILFRVILDIFRSHDLGGWGKAGWLFFVIVLPFLGVFVYLIARGHKMAERDKEAAEAQDAAFRSSVRDAAAGAGNGGTSTADQISKLAVLRDPGLISDAEFEQQKARVLA